MIAFSQIMKSGRLLRYLLDFAMLMFLLAALAYCITGAQLHEYFGLAVVLLFAAHNVLNGRWYVGLGRGRYGALRILSVSVNLMLAVLAVAVFVSGAMLSEYVFGFGGASMEVRQIHSICANWLFVLAGAHLGLHWKLSLKTPLQRTNVVIFACYAAYGVHAWIQRNMFEKLFCGYSFDFWSGELPAGALFLQNLGVFFLAAFLAWLLVRFAKFKNKQKETK